MRAESLVSVHMSYPDVSELQQIAALELRDKPQQELVEKRYNLALIPYMHRLINRLSRKPAFPKDLDKKWNDAGQVPNRDKIDITP